ncbi:putative methyltransferase-domain-containing protein [Paraphoma chrysanthemicola]|nr:putative methyltransferase-domain-containing protein [Paraphoma chrysanthemicola]
MRYIRFLKTPRVVNEKGTSRSQISCLITVTSDLGDSFLPSDVQLSAELLSSNPREEVLVWRTVQWTAGMRSLAITFPLIKSRTSPSLRVKVGIEPKSKHDTFDVLCDKRSCGIVSAWSCEFNPLPSFQDVEKLVERRFCIQDNRMINIFEETGESIARHLWDAGITLSCHIDRLLDLKNQIEKTKISSSQPSSLQVLELGTGCGMVGISLATIVPGANVLLTDLAEAREIVERNIRESRLAKGANVTFQELDWDEEMPSTIKEKSSPLDMVVAADCTYNSDSSPALVNTLQRLAEISPQVQVAIAMKMRHSSEEVFFDLMAEAGFHEVAKLDFPLPGDVEVGEEVVYLHAYQYNPST